MDANVRFLGTDIHPDPKVSPRRLPINYGGGGWSADRGGAIIRVEKSGSSPPA